MRSSCKRGAWQRCRKVSVTCRRAAERGAHTRAVTDELTLSTKLGCDRQTDRRTSSSLY